MSDRHLDEFRVAPPAGAGGETPRRAKVLRPGNSEPIILGPISMTWLWRAGRLKNKNLHVGISLWRLANWTRSLTVVFSAVRCAREWKISNASVSRSLKGLQKVGLVEISKGPGRAFRVTLLPTLPTCQEDQGGGEKILPAVPDEEFEKQADDPDQYPTEEGSHPATLSDMECMICDFEAAFSGADDPSCLSSTDVNDEHGEQGDRTRSSCTEEDIEEAIFQRERAQFRSYGQSPGDYHREE